MSSASGSKRHHVQPSVSDYSQGKEETTTAPPTWLESESFVGRLAEELQKYQKANDQKRSRCFLLGILGGAIGLMIFTAVGVALTIEHSNPQRIAPGDVLVNNKDGRPLRVQQHFLSVPLDQLEVIPLEQIEKVATVSLQWPADQFGGARQFYYTVESVFRDLDEGITEVRLSSNHRLVATDGTVTLQDSQGNTLGVFDFAKMKDVFETVGDVFEGGLEDGEDVVGENGEPRQLGKKKKAAKHAEPVTVGGGGEGAYCAYGCGRLSVTYPYYYRPFFGYGYPLVGTERMFPGGYGGNPVTEMAANGLMGNNQNNLASGVNLGGSVINGAPGGAGMAYPPGY